MARQRSVTTPKCGCGVAEGMRRETGGRMASAEPLEEEGAALETARRPQRIPKDSAPALFAGSGKPAWLWVCLVQSFRTKASHSLRSAEPSRSSAYGGLCGPCVHLPVCAPVHIFAIPSGSSPSPPSCSGLNAACYLLSSLTPLFLYTRETHTQRKVACI